MCHHERCEHIETRRIDGRIDRYRDSLLHAAASSGHVEVMRVLLQVRVRVRHPPTYLSSYLPIYLSTYRPIYLSTFLPFYLSTYPPVYLSTYRPIDLSTYL